VKYAPTFGKGIDLGDRLEESKKVGSVLDVVPALSGWGTLDARMRLVPLCVCFLEIGGVGVRHDWWSSVDYRNIPCS